LKLLFDQNLSWRLVRRVADVFPDSAHVRDFGLQRAPDDPVWERAAADGFVLVSKDDDFLPRSLLRGPPPKVVWVRLGNCSTGDVEALLRARFADIEAFVADEREAILVLARRS
jgi:predicted nuclease of predicted toxin-antitoxin system